MLLDGCLGILCLSLAGGPVISLPLHVKRSAYCPALVGLKSASASKSAIRLSVWFLYIAWWLLLSAASKLPSISLLSQRLTLVDSSLMFPNAADVLVAGLQGFYSFVSFIRLSLRYMVSYALDIDICSQLLKSLQKLYYTLLQKSVGLQKGHCPWSELIDALTVQLGEQMVKNIYERSLLIDGSRKSIMNQFTLNTNGFKVITTRSPLLRDIKSRLTPFASQQLVEIFSFWQSPSSGLRAGRWSWCWFSRAGQYQGSSRGYACLSIEPQLPVGFSFLSNGYEMARWLQRSKKMSQPAGHPGIAPENQKIVPQKDWHNQLWCLMLESLTDGNLPSLCSVSSGRVLTCPVFFACQSVSSWKSPSTGSFAGGWSSSWSCSAGLCHDSSRGYAVILLDRCFSGW
ncbi:hypothetical protein MP228_004299 [Amoeboaphelidium protococcarum]|nr:hypothetical protein MP228_004299 [Amoeboaphelidium protococcarum]